MNKFLTVMNDNFTRSMMIKVVIKRIKSLKSLKNMFLGYKKSDKKFHSGLSKII